MSQIIGNAQAHFRGPGVHGLGAQNTGPGPRSHVSISGTAGEVVALAGYQAIPRLGEVDIVVQCSGPVSMRFSLSNAGLAADPDPEVRSSAIWTDPEDVSAGAIQEVNGGFPFSAVEITFTTASTVIFYVR